MTAEAQQMNGIPVEPKYTPTAAEAAETARKADLDRRWSDGTAVILATETDRAKKIEALEQAATALRALDAAPVAGAAFEIIPTTEIAKPLPPRIYPVKGFAMTKGPPTVLCSYSYGGKTLIAYDLLLSVASGGRAWGQFSCTAARAVIFDYEQGRHESIDRLQRVARGRGIDLLRDAAPRLELISLPPIFLNTPGAESAYARATDGVTVAFLDTFAAATPGEDENDKRIAEHLLMLGRVSEKNGCNFLVAHHQGKAGKDSAKDKDPRERMRGNSSLFGAAGYVYDLSGGKGEPKLMQQSKARGLGDPPMEDFYLQFSVVDLRAFARPLEEHETSDPGDVVPYFNPSNPSDPGGFLVTYKTKEQINPPTPPAKAADALRLRILDVIRQHPGCCIAKVKELVTGKGVSGAAITTAIAAMHGDKVIHREELGRNQAALYLPGQRPAVPVVPSRSSHSQNDDARAVPVVLSPWERTTNRTAAASPTSSSPPVTPTSSAPPPRQAVPAAPPPSVSMPTPPAALAPPGSPAAAVPLEAPAPLPRFGSGGTSTTTSPRSPAT